ncbi:MAG TPA: DNA polymerase III subunit beta [Candidatus Binatia bacterium]|nr:DNA polymerase III subunit beta [Candidatus Binatia bacterium]
MNNWPTDVATGSTLRCTVAPSALSSSLSLVSRAVSPRSTLPVLSNVLLETEKEGLRVTATNLDLTISALVPATVLEEGRITVPARLIAEYVASLEEPLCTMEVEARTQILRLSSGAQRTNLHGIDAAEFPPLPAREAEPLLEVDAAQFQQGVAQTSVAASGDEQTPVLTGVLIQVEGSQLTLVATDRHRLAVKHLEVQPRQEGVPRVTAIVPARHLSEVARAVNPGRPLIALTFSPNRNQVFFTLRDVEVSSRLIEGNYPNYSQVIPPQSATTVVLPTAVLLKNARTASVLARDAANPVRLRAAVNELEIRAQTAEVGDHDAPIPAKVDGDEVQVAFNSRYLLDALQAIDAEDVELGFNGPLQPAAVRPHQREDYLSVIMPVRVP